MNGVLPTTLKFGRGGEEAESFRYPNLYQREVAATKERLLVGPSGGHCALLAELAACLPEPLSMLYVLVVPRGGAEDAAARYESPRLSYPEVAAFIREHEKFLQADGRHHLWVSHPGVGTIVYDRHEILYAYGPLDDYVTVLRGQGLTEGDVVVPVPHWHCYHAEYDGEMQALLARWQWVKTPLREQDEE